MEPVVTLAQPFLPPRVRVGCTQGKTFGWLVTSLHCAALVAFALATQSIKSDSNDSKEDQAAASQLYNLYIGVSMMMFVGFGYLMTFLRWYGLGAAGLTMLVTCLGVELALLVEPLFDESFAGSVTIDMAALLNANFAVAAFLISFGGLIGKVGPAQLVVLVVLETGAYCANKKLVLERWLEVADVGGTITIHMFGAYFGLAAAQVLGRPANTTREKASVTSDVTSLLGTVVLWVYWPSFVAGTLPPGTAASNLALSNTIIALVGSTLVTFAASALLSGGRLRPVDVQNASLAGGVAIGATANLVSPFAALLIGSLAGLVSALGFGRVQDALLSRLGLHDSCGIHNLHGMPSLVGGLASALGKYYISDGEVASAAGQPGTQMAGIGVTLLVAVVCGSATGAAMKALKDEESARAPFDDSAHWEVADDFA